MAQFFLVRLVLTCSDVGCWCGSHCDGTCAGANQLKKLAVLCMCQWDTKLPQEQLGQQRGWGRIGLGHGYVKSMLSGLYWQ